MSRRNTDPSAPTLGDTAESGRRRDGWVVTYKVQVHFDTDLERRRYDYVGTVVSCGCCDNRLPLQDLAANLVQHAQEHEALLSIDRVVEEVVAEPRFPLRGAGPRPPRLLP